MKLTFHSGGQPQTIDLECSADGIHADVAGERVAVHPLKFDAPAFSFVAGGQKVIAHVAIDGNRRWVHCNGQTRLVERGQARAAHPDTLHSREGTGSGLVVAPMPGQVRALLAQPGDDVTEGQPLLLLEAMKMEIRITAPTTGQLQELSVQVGESVEREQILGQVIQGEA